MNLFDSCSEFIKNYGNDTIEIAHPFFFKKENLFFNLENYAPRLRLNRVYEHKDYKYCLDYLTPFNNLWITIYKEYSPEELLDKILINGLHILIEKFSEFTKIKNFFNHKSKTVISLESELIKHNQHITSFFASENGINESIELKIYTITKESYNYRYFRKGVYYYNLKREIFYAVFWRSDFLEDKYLQDFLPKECIEYEDLESEINLDDKIEYCCILNQKLTDLLKEKYDSIAHLKYLTNEGRQLDMKHDHKYFIQSLGNN